MERSSFRSRQLSCSEIQQLASGTMGCLCGPRRVPPSMGRSTRSSRTCAYTCSVLLSRCLLARLLARSFASLSTTHSQRCIVTHPGESSLVTRRVRAVDNTRAPEYHVDGAQHLRKRRGVPARASQRRRCFRLLSCESPPEKWRCCACTLKTRIKT
jgi:hypothetical protein